MVYEQLRSQQIEALLLKNRIAFTNWVNRENAFQTLAIPQEAGDVFIPKRILEISSRPIDVHSVLLESDPRHFRVLILEHSKESISDPKKFEHWQEQQPKEEIIVRGNPYSNTDSPEGIDYQHIRYDSLISSGRVSLKDKIYLDLMLDVPHGHNNIVEIRNFYDRPELQGKGIGADFFKRMEMVLKALGFEYLTGSVISPHPGFFRKIGFVKYLDLAKEVQDQLPSGYSTQYSGIEGWMVKRL